MSKLDPQFWTPYWNKKEITTFGNGKFTQNYDESILEFWSSVAEGEFNRVADLATGNGALAWIFNDLLNQDEKQTLITGVDFANIKPFKNLNRKPEDYPSVDFIANNPIEVLPFNDSSIDLVVSQYGLEYSDLTQTIPELGRVLTKKGKMAFIMHDTRSTIYQGVPKNLDDIRHVVEDLALHDLLLKLDNIFESEPDKSKLAQNIEYNTIAKEIMETHKKAAIVVQRAQNKQLNEYFEHLTNILSNKAQQKTPKKKTPSRREKTIKVRDFIVDHLNRISDLHAVALDEVKRNDLIELIRQQGFKILEDDIIHYQGEFFGSTLIAQRA